MSNSQSSSPAVAVSSFIPPPRTPPQPTSEPQPAPKVQSSGEGEPMHRSTSIGQTLKSDVEASDTGSRPRRSAVSEDEHAKSSNRKRVKASAAYRLPRLLPYDKSLYSEEYLPMAAVATSSTTLAELAHLIRLQGYQERRRSHARVRLHRWLVSTALSSRLVHCGDLAKHPLMEAFRTDDKRSFATLYNAIHDVRNSCDATRRYSLLEPDLEFSRTSTAHGHERPYSDKTFLHEIPNKTREELTAFLSALRTDPDFLVQRILSLTGPEIETLASFRPVIDTFAVMARPAARGKVLGAGINQRPSSTPSPIERLLSFQRHDPLSALFYTIFAASSGPDSAEDLRRTEVWSTVCAKLVADPKPGSERLLHCVLDVFAEMREWPGKQSLELYLMQLLQDGQFLLERKPEPVRTRILDDQLDTKFVIRQEEFFDAALKRLFEIVDDEPSAGGIPEGVLEIGLAVHRKIAEKKHRAVMQRFIVHRWFFAKYLTNAIINPEHHGIMTGYYISETARKTILEPIAIKAQKHVLDMTYNWQQNIPVPPEIRTHIDGVLARFKQTSRSATKPVLLPAKAVTSPRETVEVQPYLVLCPSDIITLVNGLFPERRPPSGQFEKGFPFMHTGLASAASSMSGLSVPFPPASSTPGDGNSVLSMSVSSFTSDTTSRAPLLEESDKGASHTSLEPAHDLSRVDRPLPTEEYGRKLRYICSEMTRILGSEATAGSCHPCAERWAVLYVAPDGRRLHLRARKDYEEDDDPEDETTSSDSDEEGVGRGIDLATEYHQLKQAIAKLVQEYEIPKELAPDSESKGFSNRTSMNRNDGLSPRKKGKIESKAESRKEAPSPTSASKNPWLNGTQSQIAKLLASEQTSSASDTPSRPLQARTVSEPQPSTSRTSALTPKGKFSPLVVMLEAAVHQCQARSDYVTAQHYHRTLQQLRNISAPSLTRNGYAPLLNYFSRGPRDSLGKCASAIEEFEAWSVWLKQAQERADIVVESMMGGLNLLRDKMWYMTDVCHSAAYEEAKNVAMALRTMGLPPKSQDGKQQQPKQKPAKSVTSTFLLKQEGQILELMASSNDMAGPNKLADDQSEMTAKWLLQYGIENFCKGEERIHRFCLEVDRCVNKLVGDGILDGPVLWSSELYRRDKDILDSGREKGDLLLTGMGSLHIAGEEDVKSQSRTLDFASRPSINNLRAIAARNPSQQSFDSGKWSSGKPEHLMDSQDYFGTLSPVLAIDSNMTFWSPYQGTTPTQPLSTVTSPTMRPRTSSSTRSSVLVPPAGRNTDEKRRFLLDLKQALTGLLLSDLGTVVFNNGCETDAWFSGELGQECISRKEAEDRRRKRIARKKSMKSLKSAKAAAERAGADHRSLPSERSGSGTEVPTSTGEQSASTSSDATARSSAPAAPKKVLEFPYNSAFRRLLHTFTTNPNPFSKLHALYELEVLIVASLSTKSNSRSYADSLSRLPTVPQSPTLGAVPELSSRERHTSVPVQNAQTLEDVIANVAERRSASMNGQHASHARQSSDETWPPAQPGESETMSPKAGSITSAPSTDMIVEALQGLFRDPEIRPKTLFRDLQYIAAFVPGQMLDRTSRGKAFWDAALAALGLKQDVCRVMIEIADDIVALNTESRTGHAAAAAASVTAKATESTTFPPPGTEQPAPAPTEPAKPKKESAYEARIAQYSMADAAKMLIITAKEGDAVAERELAIFYLTHPELLPRTLLPLTKPKDVFKSELIAQRERDRTKKGEQVLERADPVTMCVAHHWMECSKKGGDQLATKYLRARDEIEKIP